MRLPGLAFGLALLVLLVQSGPSKAPPVEAANLQGDVDCNDELELDDLLAMLQREGGLDVFAPCLPVAGDVNCDGVIDLLDSIWLLRYLAAVGLAVIPDCPPPGDPVDAPVDAQFIGLDLNVSAELLCGEVPFHQVTAGWELINFELPVLVTVIALYSWGPSESMDSDQTSGQTVFMEADQGGGAVTVVLEVRDPAAPEDPPYAQTEEFLLLDSCFDPPPVPLPEFGFTAPTADPPDPPLAAPPGTIEEVDVAHAGGSPFGPTADVTVVGVGTGAAWRLYTFGTDTPWTPFELNVAANGNGPFSGHDIKLRTLTPDLSPKLELELVIVAYIDGGNLWLSSWRVNADGTMTHLSKRGYGANAGVIVDRYAIAHRALPAGTGGVGEAVIVTPVIGTQVTPQGTAGAGDPAIRTITWTVNGATGVISGKQDSGPWGDPHTDTELAVEHIRGGEAGETFFVISYRRDDDAMTNTIWNVSDNANPSMVGSHSSGRSLRGGSNVLYEYDYMALAPLAQGGYASAGITGSDSPQVASWEVRLSGCDGACYYAPFRIGDDEDDAMLGAGVELSLDSFPTLTDGSSNKIQGGATQAVWALLTDQIWEDDFGQGAGEVYSETPVTPFTVTGIASVTKVMTLFLAVEAVNDGDVSLNDIVEIDEEAANVGGSQMNVALGEKQSLENLLYGMMMVSGNDAALAIGKHIAGSTEDFVDMMNFRATDLGMLDTIYSQPAGGGYSNPQDQVTLWLEGYEDPLFREFATRKVWDACGETEGGDEICRFLVKFNDSGYPGLEGWKGGNLGFHQPDLKELGVPLCTACLIAQATRLGRTMMAGLQQSGDTWGDSSDLFDYGFQKLFAPDFVAHKGQAGIAQDFAIDAITEGLIVLARIEGDDALQVCTFDVQLDLGSIEEIGCASPRIPDMPGGVAPKRTQVEIVRSGTLLWEGEYITAYWLAGHVHLSGWRIGPKEP